jgi:protein SCO1/2
MGRSRAVRPTAGSTAPFTARPVSDWPVVDGAAGVTVQPHFEASGRVGGVRRRLFPVCPLAALVVLLTFSACGGGENARVYELKGQILAIRPDAHEVLIKHGDIPGFMPAMTMPYKVRGNALLSAKAPGDLVTAKLMVGKDEAWLSAIDKTGSAPLEDAAAFPAASFAKPLTAGDEVPDATLTSDDGSLLSLSAWRDQAVAITFIYIRCPLPQFCPMMDRRFAEIQKAVTADPALKARVRLLSVSFDPEHDTPAAMKAHAGTLGADPSIWRFATAAPDIVDPFAARFGVNVIRERDGTITHNLRTVIVAPGGRVANVYDGGEWTASQAIADLQRAASAR